MTRAADETFAPRKRFPRTRESPNRPFASRWETWPSPARRRTTIARGLGAWHRPRAAGGREGEYGEQVGLRRRRLTERLRIWLERGESEGGRGFWLRDAATGDALGWNDERLAAAGASVVAVAGSTYRNDALQDGAFEPGKPLALVAEPENEHDPNAIAIWDAERRLQAGYVPADIAKGVTLPLQAVSLWEWRDADRRVGLRVLVAPSEVWIGRPRA